MRLRKNVHIKFLIFIKIVAKLQLKLNTQYNAIDCREFYAI